MDSQRNSQQFADVDADANAAQQFEASDPMTNKQGSHKRAKAFKSDQVNQKKHQGSLMSEEGLLLDKGQEMRGSQDSQIPQEHAEMIPGLIQEEKGPSMQLRDLAESDKEQEDDQFMFFDRNMSLSSKQIIQREFNELEPTAPIRDRASGDKPEAMLSKDKAAQGGPGKKKAEPGRGKKHDGKLIEVEEESKTPSTKVNQLARQQTIIKSVAGDEDDELVDESNKSDGSQDDDQDSDGANGNGLARSFKAYRPDEFKLSDKDQQFLKDHVKKDEHKNNCKNWYQLDDE